MFGVLGAENIRFSMFKFLSDLDIYKIVHVHFVDYGPSSWRSRLNIGHSSKEDEASQTPVCSSKQIFCRL